MARPIEGKEKKKSYGVRIEPKVYAKIVKKYGSLTEFINHSIKKNLGK